MAEDQNYKLDASQYFQEIDRVIKANESLNATIDELADAFVKTSGNFDDLTVTIGKQTAAGDKLRATLIGTADGFVVQSKNLSLLTQNYNFNQVAITKTIQSMDELLRKERELAAAPSPNLVADFRTPQGDADNLAQQNAVEQLGIQLATEKRAEEVRIQEVLNSQVGLYNQLKQQAVALEEAENLRVQTLIDQAEAIDQANRNQEAQLSSQNLSNKFLSNAPNLATATAGEVNKVAAAIGKIQSLISEGTISATRAEQIMASTLARTGETFVGVEQQVAGLTLRLQSASEGLGSSYAAEAAKIEAANATLTDSFRTVDQTGDNAGRHVTLSWQSMSRLLITQAIHLTVYKLVSALTSGVEAADQFEIRISEIRTLAQDNQLSFNSWAASVESLSNQFGNPILDVAEGAYETLSNQVAKGTDTFRFLADALKFSQVTLASTKDSVNLLSAAINSYKLSVDDTERISAVFFNTINLGRIRADEIANTLGRVTALSAPLGISLEEVSAALATLTINGVPASEAMSLLDGILNQLLHPSQEMTKALKDLGFSSGDAALASEGLVGLLRQLEDAAHGSTGELANFFTNIRARRAELGLTGSALQGFEQNLKDIGNIQSFDLASKISIESAGKRLEIQANELKNFFINDFGRGFIDFVDNLTNTTDQFGDKTSHLADIIIGLIHTLEAAGIGFASYYAASQLAALGATFLEQRNLALIRGLVGTEATVAAVEGTFIGLEGVLVAVGGFLATPIGIIATSAAVLGGLWLQQSENAEEASRKLDTLAVDAQNAIKDETRAIERELDQQKRDFNSAADQIFGSYFSNSQRITQVLRDQAELSAEIYKDLANKTKIAFESATKDIEESIRQSSANAKTALAGIQTAQQQITGLQDKLSRSQFDSQIKLLPSGQQVDAIFTHISDLANKASIKLESPTTDTVTAKTNQEEGIKLQNAALEETNTLISKKVEAENKSVQLEKEIEEIQARQAAQQTQLQDTAPIRQLQELEKSLQTARTTGNRQQIAEIQQQIQTQREVVANDKSTATDSAEQKRLDDLTAEKAKIDDTIAAFNKHADIQSVVNDLEKQFIESLNKETGILERNAKAEKDKADQQQKNLEILRQSLTAIDSVKLTDKIKESIQTPEDAQKFLEQNFNKPFNEAINSGAIQSQDLLDKLYSQRAELQMQLDDTVTQHQKKNQDDLVIQKKKALEDDFKQASNQIASTKIQQQQALEQLQLLLSSKGILAKGASLSQEDLLNAGVTGQQLSIIPNIQAGATPINEGLVGIKQLLAEISDAASKNQGIVTGGDADKFNEQANRAQTLLGFLTSSTATLTQAQKDQKVSQDELKTLPTDRISDAAVQASIDLDGLDSSAKKLQERFDKLFPEQAQAPGKALGGPIGTDTVAAWLTPGEFIVNQSSTNQYWRELQAINNKTYPQGYFASGGLIPNYIPPQLSTSSFDQNAVSNHNYGDFIFNIENSTEVDSRRVMNDIQQAVRRGTFQI